MKEHKVGERFTFNGVTLEVVAHCQCYGCYFREGEGCSLLYDSDCSGEFREDLTSVIYVEVPPTVEDAANVMGAAVVGNVDFAYIIAHMTTEGEVSIKTIGRPENIGKLRGCMIKMLEAEK